MNQKITLKRVQNYVIDHIIEVMLIVLVVIMWVAVPGFMTLDNWLNILNNQACKGIIAFGMTMVIICGQLDLSIGSTVALSGAVVAVSCQKFTSVMPLSLACIAGMLISFAMAAILGIVFGAVQHKLKMPSFIITLAAQNLIFGLAGMVCGGYPISGVFPGWFSVLGNGHVGGASGISIPVIILFIIFILSGIVMKYTTTGRSMYAVGGNPEAARLSGLHVFRSKIICFVVVQLLAALAGMIHSAQVDSAVQSYGRGWENDVIISTVIGGTSMNGGVGSIVGTLMGVIFLGVISNGLTILNVSVYTQYVVKGLLMFVAVFISTYQVIRKNQDV